MRILAIEHELAQAPPDDFASYLKAEALKAWELYQQGVIRELYFREDRPEAVLLLECATVEEAQKILNTLPLVEAGLIRFEIIPLVPYPGFLRLFK
jgi:muconolactone delta-isomerase